MKSDPAYRIRIATALSVLAHAAILALPIRERPPKPDALAAASSPLTVRLVEPAPPIEVVPPIPPRDARREAPRREPRKEPPRPEPVEKAMPREPRPIPEPPPAPAPLPTFDMAAMIAATRERRRALEAARAGPARPPPPEDSSGANMQRNLQTLARGPGTGGVFQILRKGERTAEFAFNGWQGDARRWREVIEVDAGPGGDVELAIVRRMIALIRGHYSGNFNWESHRLGRLVVLSAAPEDNEGLEEFLLREFFGVPVLKRGR